MVEISLYDFIKFYIKKWRLIVALTAIGFIAGLTYNTYIQVPVYKSNTKLLLVSPQTTQTMASQTLLNNYVDLIQSRRVLEPVLMSLHDNMSYDKLVKEVSALNPKDTAVIDVTITTTNAKKSTDIANAISQSFRNAIKDLYSTDSVIVVDPAVEVSTATNVNKPIQLAISAATGFVLSVIVVFFIFDYQIGKPIIAKDKKTIVKESHKKNMNLVKSTFISKLVKIYKKVVNNFSSNLKTQTKVAVKAKTQQPKNTATKQINKKPVKKMPSKSTKATLTRKA